MISNDAVAIMLVVGVTLCGSQFIGAQDTSQPVFGGADHFDTFHFDPPALTLTLLGRYAHSKSGDSSSSDGTTQEVLDAATHGYIYDPAFVDLSLEGAFGLSQSWYDANPGNSGSSNSTLYTYNARATFLSQKPVTLSLYATQSDQMVNVPYAPTMDEQASTYGADLDIKSQSVPTRFRLYHTEQSDTSMGGPQDQIRDYSLKQDVFEWWSQARSNNQTLTWLYQYNHVTTESGSIDSVTYDAQTANLIYAVAFGPGNSSTWTTTLDYYNQNGGFSQTRMRGDTALTLHASSTLDLFAEYLVDRSEYEDTGSTLQKVSGGFRHHLWGSLTTTGRVGANFLDDDSGSLNREQYASLAFDYTKNVPMGQVAANLTLQVDRQENDARAEPFHVIDAPYTFNDPTPVTIVNRNIIPSSIMITDATHTRVYTEGVDYTTLWFPTYVQILRAAGGAMPSNAAVLVDYTLAPQAQNTLDTFIVTMGGRYDFTAGPLNGLGVYGNYLVQDQSVSTDDPTYVADQIRDLTVGVDYHRDNWSLNGEYEHHDSTAAPFDSLRAGAQYSRRVGSDMTMAANVDYVTYRYGDTNDQLDILTTAVSAEYQFSHRLSATASAGWFRQDDTLVGSSTGTEGSLQLRWHQGKTQIYTNLRAVHLDNDSGSSDFQMLEIGITRKF